MSHSADAAEQIVNAATNVTIKGVECVSNLAGKGALNLATFLVAVIKDEKRTKGKARMRVFNGKPTKVFVIKAKDMKTFAEEAKKYGVLYAAVYNKKQTDGLVDVVVNAADAAKVNRIAERFALSTVDVEKIREDIQKAREHRQQKKDSEKDAEQQPDGNETPALDLFGKKEQSDVPKEQPEQNEKKEPPAVEILHPGKKQPPNPTMKGTETSPRSEIKSDNQSKTTNSTSDRSSVRERIRMIRNERNKTGAEKHEPIRDRTQPLRGNKPKSKTNKGR